MTSKHHQLRFFSGSDRYDQIQDGSSQKLPVNFLMLIIILNNITNIKLKIGFSQQGHRLKQNRNSSRSKLHPEGIKNRQDCIK